LNRVSRVQIQRFEDAVAHPDNVFITLKTLMIPAATATDN